MDPTEMEKFQAMKRYRRNQFLPMSVQYSLRVLLLGLFLSSPHWIPKVYSSTKLFFMVYIPTLVSVLCTPKCLFIISNIIIIFLIVESRRSRPSRQPDMYEEYVMRRQSLQAIAGTGEDKKKEAMLEEQEPVVETNEEEDEVVEQDEVKAEQDEDKKVDQEEEECGEEEEMEKEEYQEEYCGEEEEMEKEEYQEEYCGEEEEMGEKYGEELNGEDDEGGLPVEELNRRVEDFIERFNIQRKLEARMVLCCG